jgi:hypothetical protein
MKMQPRTPSELKKSPIVADETRRNYFICHSFPTIRISAAAFLALRD